MIFIKKVVNADPGDADHVGGNDWDTLDDFFADVTNAATGKINSTFEVTASKFKIRDLTDETKEIVNDVSAITTGTTRTIIYPDANVNLTSLAKTTDNLSVFAATTSLQLLGVISDETGSGLLVFNDSPTFITPVLGTPSSGTLDMTNITLDGTKAEFDTACSNDDFAYIGQANVFTQDQEIEITGAIPILTFDRPEVLVDNTTIARIHFRGFDDASATEIYAQIRVIEASDVAANPEGCLDLRVDEAGTLTTYITLNDLAGGDIDLRKPVNFSSQIGSNLILDNTNSFNGFFDVTEIATPANPAANIARLFAADVGGNTHIFQDNSTEAPIDLTTGAEVTTWTADHNTADFDLTSKPTPSTDFFEHLVEVTVTDDAGTEPMYHLNLRRDTPAAVVTRNLFEISNNDVAQLVMLNNGNVDIQNNTLIIGTGTIQLVDTDTFITTVLADDIGYNVGFGSTHRFLMDGAIQMEIGNTKAIVPNDFSFIWNGIVNRRIENNAGGFEFEIQTGENFDFQIQNTTEMTLDATALTLSAGNNLVLQASGATGFMDMGEITIPANPGANNVRVYGKLDGAVTKLFYKQEDGTEVGPLAAAGAAALPVVDTTSIAEGSADATKEVRFEVDGNTTGIIGVLATVFTTAKTVTFPDATDTLVGKATTDVFTNKSYALGGTGNALTGTAAEFDTAVTDDNFVFDGATNVLTGAIQITAGTMRIPLSATPTITVDGDFAIDTTVTDFSHGVMKFFDGEEVGVVAMPIAQFTTPTDGNVVTYDATADEFQLKAGGGAGLIFAKIVKTVDETITSDIVLSDDSELKFTPTVSKNYFGWITIRVKSGSVPDFKSAFSIPTGATILIMDSGTIGLVRTLATAQNMNLDGTVSINVTTNSQDQFIGTSFSLKMSTTAGDCNYQWAQQTSDAGATKVLANSFMIVFEEGTA